METYFNSDIVNLYSERHVQQSALSSRATRSSAPAARRILTQLTWGKILFSDSTFAREELREGDGGRAADCPAHTQRKDFSFCRYTLNY